MILLQLSTPSVKKSLLEDHQKKQEDFAHKRQIKHTSTVMEPSIPFHTLVELVDAEDITNEKNPTLDLPPLLK